MPRYLHVPVLSTLTAVYTSQLLLKLLFLKACHQWKKCIKYMLLHFSMNSFHVWPKVDCWVNKEL